MKETKTSSKKHLIDVSQVIQIRLMNGRIKENKQKKGLYTFEGILTVSITFVIGKWASNSVILLNSQNMMKNNFITLKVTYQSFLLVLVATEVVNVLTST